MSDPVLSQLVSVETDLAQQVETLETKLTQIREQRQGVLTVITLFQDSDGERAPATEAVVSTPAEESAPEESAPEESAPEESPPAAKKTAAKAKPGRKPKASKSTPRKKKDGRAANWQKYVQPDYREAALPEAVSSVLRSQPSEVFTIADVMSSIFSEDMPRTSFLKARNRISNILSAGARDGTWYRGRNGRYSQSENVTKAK